MSEKEKLLYDFVKFVSVYVELQDGELVPTKLAGLAQKVLERYRNESN